MNAAEVDFNDVHRIRVHGGRLVHAVVHHVPAGGSRRAVFHTTACGTWYVGPQEGHRVMPPDSPIECRRCVKRLEADRASGSVTHPVMPVEAAERFVGAGTPSGCLPLPTAPDETVSDEQRDAT